jgi:hypothetical protein
MAFSLSRRATLLTILLAPFISTTQGLIVKQPSFNIKSAINKIAAVSLGVLVLQGPFLRMISAKEFPLQGSESIMSAKGHGTSENPVQSSLRWNVDVKLADRITNYNRHYAENYGYFQQTAFLKEADTDKPITFYDSVTGKPLFIAPQGRSFEDFKRESTSHGWPSFRDNEVVWENVRVLSDGETVSLSGTHLGHNLPDMSGNR